MNFKRQATIFQGSPCFDFTFSSPFPSLPPPPRSRLEDKNLIEKIGLTRLGRAPTHLSLSENHPSEALKLLVLDEARGHEAGPREEDGSSYAGLENLVLKSLSWVSEITKNPVGF